MRVVASIGPRARTQVATSGPASGSRCLSTTHLPWAVLVDSQLDDDRPFEAWVRRWWIDVWVPETSRRPVDLAIRGRRCGGRHDPPVTLKLAYKLVAKLLSWMVLRAHSDAANEIEILVLRHQLAVLGRRTPGRGSAGPIER